MTPLAAQPSDTSPSTVEQLTTQLQTAILDGMYTPGQLLPGKSVLARHYDGTPEDIHKALGVLRARHLVRRVDGAGMFVANPLPAQPPAPQHTAR